MKRALILGAGGFIGSHLAHRLKAHGYYVRGVDLKRPEWERPAVDEFLIGDLQRGNDTARAFGDGFDEVYQLAADMGGLGYISYHFADVMRNNMLINLNVADAARMIGVGRLSLPKFARSKRTRARRFSLELNNWSVKSSSTRMFRARRCAINNSANAGSSWITRIMSGLSMRAITQSVMAEAVARRSFCPAKHPSPKKLPSPGTATTASLPCSESTVSFTLPVRI